MPSTTDSQSRNRRENRESDSSSSSVYSPSSAVSSHTTVSSNSSIYQREDFAVPANAHRLVAPSLGKLQKTIEILRDHQARNNQQTSYLHVSDIDQALFKRLQEDADLFRGVKAFIDHSHRQVLYKMPSRVHEQIATTFHSFVILKLAEIGLSMFNKTVISCGSGRQDGVACSKEPDWSFMPGNMSDGALGGSEYPSLILEVGYSESTNHLRSDARWWYANTHQNKSQLGTKLVVLIHADPADPRNIDIEIWTEIANPSTAPDTRGRPAKALSCTQRASLRGGSVVGAPLTLDFELMMRRPPGNEKEGDIIMQERDLKLICGQDY